MPIIGTTAAASARGYGGMRTFGPNFSSLAAIYMPQTGQSTNFQVFNVGLETITNFVGGLTGIEGGVASGGLGNNTVAGYVQEGYGEGADFNKISFATQVASFVDAPGGTKDGGAGISNDGTAGYIGGGTAGGAYLNSILKVAFTNDSVSNASATIYDSVIQNFAWSTGANFGYIGAGFTQGGVTTGSVSKFNYSNETTSSTNGINSLRLGSTGSSASKGYIFGGYNNGGSNVSEIQKWTYSNDTQSGGGTTLAAANRETNAGGTYSLLYVCGGFTSAQTKVIQKYTTSTETISTLGVELTYFINSGANSAANNRGA